MRGLSLFPICCALIGNYACDNRTMLHPPPSGAVTVSPSSATVDLSSTRQFTAVVTSSSNQAVNWALSGTGCSGTECGTISAAGLYRAPDNYLPGAAVTITASSQVDSSQTGTAAVTINSSVTVAVDPQTQNVDIGATKQFSAIVNGSANKAVTWSISGNGCADNGCGWINETTGLYTGPDDPPNPATFTVKAVSLADNAKSGTGSVNVTTTSNAGFAGNYTFLFNGFEASARAVAIAGAFIADGYGTIRAGILDMNRFTGPDPQQPVLITGGSYSYGADNRGRLLLNTSVGLFSFRYAMNAPNLSAHAGRIIAFQPNDPTHLTGAGMIKKASSVLTFGGNFGFGFSGELDTGRAGAVGRLDMGSPARGITGRMDLNLAGGSVPVPQVSGSYDVNGFTHDEYGRGQAQLTAPQFANPINLAFYIVSNTEAFFITRDRRSSSLPLLSGQALKQVGRPYQPDAIDGPSVFYLTGLLSPGTSVTIARYVANAGTGTLVGVMDQNADGVITSNAPFSGSIANLSPFGRGELNLQVGPTLTPYTFYLVDRNKAFLMQAQAAEVGVGFMEGQNGTGFSNASLSGNYVLGTASPATCGCTSVSGVAALNGSGGQFVGARDKSRAEGVSSRDSLTGTFNVTSPSTGRGTMTTTTPSTENSAMYIISSDKFVAIDVDPDVGVAVVTIFDR